MLESGIVIREFREEFVEKTFGNSPASHYVWDYLSEIGARSIVHESHYVDRHYLDDFKNYYSRSFDSPRAHCQRLHFFALSAAELTTTINGAYRSVRDRKAAEKLLCEKYLGFSVVRPLEGAKMGRTVLRTYPIVDGKFRRYEVVRPYWVNVAGLRLVVEGLAYQQQDRGAAACASTALWSALQRVAYVAGHRTPTPCAITAAAASPFPASHGLEDYQMATALSSLGYVADQFSPVENRALFRAKVVACLESQLPVVLLMTRKQRTGAGEITIGHAVTVTGFRQPEAVIQVLSPVQNAPPIPMRAGSLQTVYVHDDNLGSHAHYELFDDTENDADGYPKLGLRRGDTDRKKVPWWKVDKWTIFSALVPKPEKMRLPVERLFFILLQLRWMIDVQLFPKLELDYGARFSTGVGYKRDLVELPLDRKPLASFLSKLTLPRHIGLVSVHHADSLLCEFVLDVSEVERDPGKPSVLAVLAPGIDFQSPAWKLLVAVAAHFECLMITGPATAAP